MYANHFRPKKNPSIGVVQICSSDNIEDNYNKIKYFVNDCVEKGAKLVCLPENFASMSSSSLASSQIAEPLDGPIMTKYSSLAKELKVWLSLGGFQEKIDANPLKRYNTHVIINDEGQIVSAYRKLHLFDIDLSKAGGVALSESEFVEKGMDMPEIVDSPLGKLGPTIVSFFCDIVSYDFIQCYDVRFPELYRKCIPLGNTNEMQSYRKSSLCSGFGLNWPAQ
ncbi:nitrilase homolog 1-like [Stylonychia lemnae]|uniref:Nitrilase homolog 1-like n=1 Tax=Stylonychia lemnae TaxID=5949 RepID=A0A077ZQK0_STYLE|nr:nitrilase homolog 1-like [Stylonychia lemnae]|eukprot:CDW72198.1 nitrilase homolog 1-like [Stylonychia lemnae]